MSESALLIAPDSIGEAVMAQPLLALLRQREPALRIDVLCPRRLASVFRAMPEVGEVFDAAGTGPALVRLGRACRLGWRLRRHDYRRAYALADLPGSTLATLIAGIPERIGYRGDAHRLLLNRVHEPQAADPLPRVEHYARLAFAPREPLTGGLPAPRLARRVARERAVRARFALDPSAPLIALCPDADGSPGCWPRRHYAALANLLVDEWPEAQLVLIGSARNRAAATEIAALSGVSLHNLAGETSVGEAIALVSQASGVVSGNTGLMHLAAAFGRPQVAIFGSGDPRHSPPRSPRARVEWLHPDCPPPCAPPACVECEPDCLDRIAPSAVFESLSRVMRFEPAGARPVR